MKKLCYIISFMMVLVSCSIKEQRDECPSFLDVTVASQYDFIYRDGKAWCNIYNSDEKLFDAALLFHMDQKDTTLYYSILPRRIVSAIVSNRDIVTDCVTVELGEEYGEVYITRKDIVCFNEYVQETISKINKQFCILKIKLSEISRPYASQLIVGVEGDYDGVCIPSMKAHKGPYSFHTIFNEEGEAVIRLPRQGGEGLKLYLQLEGESTKSYVDLYDKMRMSHYVWTDESLKDFEIEVSLNSVTMDLDIVDWNIIDFHNIIF